jgi:hypothetical protein
MQLLWEGQCTTANLAFVLHCQICSACTLDHVACCLLQAMTYLAQHRKQLQLPIYAVHGTNDHVTSCEVGAALSVQLLFLLFIAAVATVLRQHAALHVVEVCSRTTLMLPSSCFSCKCCNWLCAKLHLSTLADIVQQCVLCISACSPTEASQDAAARPPAGQ